MTGGDVQRREGSYEAESAYTRWKLATQSLEGHFIYAPFRPDTNISDASSRAPLSKPAFMTWLLGVLRLLW